MFLEGPNAQGFHGMEPRSNLQQLFRNKIKKLREKMKIKRPKIPKGTVENYIQYGEPEIPFSLIKADSFYFKVASLKSSLVCKA